MGFKALPKISQRGDPQAEADIMSHDVSEQKRKRNNTNQLKALDDEQKNSPKIQI